VALGIGGSHSCGIRSAGALWCWGDNSSGQLGNGTAATLDEFGYPLDSPVELAPVRVGTASDWVALGIGGSHSCGIRSAGELWCWGDNTFGQLDGTAGGSPPTPARVGTASDWTAVSSGPLHSCGIRGDRTRQCWGDGKIGQLGDGTTVFAYSPVPTGGTTTWTRVSVGKYHLCGIRADGSLWCWGRNDTGELGDGSTDSRTAPVRVGTASDWTAVSTGWGYSCGTRAEGSLWCWGDNYSGQLGDGSTVPVDENGFSEGFLIEPAPVRVGAASDWTAVSAGDSHTCGIRSGGALWCWGNNGSGQLGDGSTDSRTAPVRVGTASDWTAVSTGWGYSCGIRAEGSLWCWGENTHGQLGNGTAALLDESGYPLDYPVQRTPVRVGAASDWTAVSAGMGHTCGIRAEGGLWCWGDNEKGVLGDGTASVRSADRPYLNNNRSAPVRVGTASDWTTVAVGDAYTCGRRVDGSLWCWGANVEGQLGDGTAVDSPVPVRVAGGADDWTTVSGTEWLTCGIRADGTLWCWGCTEPAAFEPPQGSKWSRAAL
jgi:alpha-tubulin suppressor-like RCC1 family protein